MGAALAEVTMGSGSGGIDQWSRNEKAPALARAYESS